MARVFSSPRIRKPLRVFLILMLVPVSVMARPPIDRKPPILASVAPLDGGNTSATYQSIVARSTDDISGIDPLSVRATLRDLTVDGDSKSLSATFVVGVIRTAAVRMEPGHHYEATVRAADRAGNRAAPLRITFRAITLEPPAIDAEIPSTRASAIARSSEGTTVTFSDVPLRLPEYRVPTKGSSLHAGYGYIGQSVSLENAKVHVTAAGKKVVVPLGELMSNELSPITTYGQIVELWPGQIDRTLGVRALDLTIEHISVTLPIARLPSVMSASLSMHARTKAFVPVCADPSVACPSASWPSADPFPFYVSAQEASFITTREDAAEAKTGAGIGDQLGIKECDESDWLLPEMRPLVPGPYCVYLEFDDLAPGLLLATAYDAVTKGWVQAVPLAPQPRLNGSQSVAYPSGYPIQLPANYQSDCALLSCAADESSSASQAAAAEGDSRYCETTNGGENCTQFIYLRAMHYWPSMTCDAQLNCYPDRTKNYFQAFILATQDLYDDAVKDEMGLWWDAPLTSFGELWRWSWRSYKWPYMWDFSTGKCIYAGTEIDGGGGEASTPTSHTMRHTNLAQMIGSAVDNCTSKNGTAGMGPAVKKALYEASLVWALFETHYHEQVGRMSVNYGHRRTGAATAWSCSYPGGCGFTVQPAPQNAWEIETTTNFNY